MATIKNTTLRKTRRKYNPHISKRKSIYYIILNKISINKNVNKIRKKNQSSFIDKLRVSLFTVSEEVENDYYVYKLKKNSYKKQVRRFSFYNSDGSFNCVGILLGMCSDDDYTRKKSFEVFIVNLDKIVKSKDFEELVILIFSCSVFLYFYLSFCFNLSEFINHKLISIL